jgi:hypothetical protein
MSLSRRWKGGGSKSKMPPMTASTNVVTVMLSSRIAFMKSGPFEACTITGSTCGEPRRNDVQIVQAFWRDYPSRSSYRWQTAE